MQYFHERSHHTPCGCRERLLAGREREVRAVMRWVLDNPFVLRSGFDLIVSVNDKYDR